MRIAPTPSGLWGVYDHGYRLITLKPGMLRAQHISTFAHELGHAYYGHHGHSPRNEGKADRWAARQLLTFDHLLDEARFTIDTGELAAALGVMPWVIEAYVETLTAQQALTMMNQLSSIYA